MKDDGNSRVDLVEEWMRKYTKEANAKLNQQFTGTREAIKIIAKEKIQEFMLQADRGLDKEERELLIHFMINSMVQSFCLGYSLGKIEGQTSQVIYL